jgi:hypothetical protein
MDKYIIVVNGLQLLSYYETALQCFSSESVICVYICVVPIFACNNSGAGDRHHYEKIGGETVTDNVRGAFSNTSLIA